MWWILLILVALPLILGYLGQIGVFPRTQAQIGAGIQLQAGGVFGWGPQAFQTAQQTQPKPQFLADWAPSHAWQNTSVRERVWISEGVIR